MAGLSVGLSLPIPWIDFCWIIFGLYWVISAFKRKATKKRESYAQRFGYTIPLVLASFLLLRPEAHDYPWLGARFVPPDIAWKWLGVGFTAAGVAVAIWARWHLGSNWSGVVTLKEGHELIRTGPYRSIRHPIYTGILLALLGTLTTIGEVRGIVALAVVWLSFYIKARREESFLEQEFGPKFAEHKCGTGMFFPKLSSGPD